MDDPGRPGPAEELRAALAEHQERDEAFAQRKKVLAQARARYEEEERAVMGHLRDLADLFVKTMDKAPRERLQITPRPVGLGRLLRSEKYVEGWRIALGSGASYILDPNGNLISPSAKEWEEPSYSTLEDWLEQRRQSVHTEYSETPRSAWGEAFSPTARPYDGDREAAQKTMYGRLDAMKASVTQTFAGILHERDLSL
jgi:hypothetical protein